MPNPVWSTAVAREGAWWTTDTLPTFPAAMPLQKANGGLFDGVFAGRPDTVARGRFLVVDRVRQGRQPISHRISAGYKEWRHEFRATVYWQAEESTGLVAELLALEQAVDALLNRIEGPFGDKSHGGAFTGVAEEGTAIEIEWAADPEESIPADGTACFSLIYIAEEHEIGV